MANLSRGCVWNEFNERDEDRRFRILTVGNHDGKHHTLFCVFAAHFHPAVRTYFLHLPHKSFKVFRMFLSREESGHVYECLFCLLEEQYLGWAIHHKRFNDNQKSLPKVVFARKKKMRHFLVRPDFAFSLARGCSLSLRNIQIPRKLFHHAGILQLVGFLVPEQEVDL